MYQQEDYLPVNRNYVFLLGCFTIIFTIIIIFTLIRTQTQTPESNLIIRQPDATYPMADLTKYNQDSDRDLIPNFIEEDAILNTYVNEIDYCEGINPTCSEDPFKKTTYVNILVDSSTSMNIPATNDKSKIQLVSSELNNLLRINLKEPFIKMQVTGFGNKGNLSFIADNESCVSNLNFKNYEQKLLNEEASNSVLKNLVANGKSPVVYSLEQAEKLFPNKQGDNLVIIITDGIDDCGAELNGAIKAILSRGIVKRVDVLSLFSPEDENQKLREAAESNGGMFSATPSIFSTINKWKKDFILSNWCKYKDQNKVYQCLNNNYSKVFTELDKQLTNTTPQNEINKIREIKSTSDFYIQNYKQESQTKLEQEFDVLYRKITE